MPMQYTPDDPQARAKADAAVRYGGQQSTLERAIANIANQLAADEAGINKYGTEGRGGINAAFDQLGTNLGVNRDIVNRDLGIQVNNVGQGFRDASQIAEAARAQAAQRLQGLHSGNSAYSTVDLAEAQAPIESLAAQFLGRNAQEDATYTGNLRNWAAQQDALMQAGIAGGERDRANRLSGFEAELLQAIAESRNLRSQQEYDYNAKLLDLIGERGAFEVSQTGTYGDKNFDRGLATAGYNLNEAQYQTDASYKQAQLAQQAQELAMRDAAMRADAARADRAEARAASATNNDDYWKALEYDLKVRGMDQETAKWLADEARADFGQKMGISEFLSRGVGIDEWGNPYDYTPALEQLLGRTDAWSAPAYRISPEERNAASALGSAATKSTWRPGSNSAFGSKANTSYTGKAPVVPRGVQGAGASIRLLG